MSVPVWWVNRHPGEARPRTHWDTMLLQSAMDGSLWPSVSLPDFDHYEAPDARDHAGGVVLIPGGFHHKDARQINDSLSEMEWAIVYVVSDEASLYPHESLVLPQHNSLTVMTPRPDRIYPDGCRFIGEGTPPGTRGMLAAAGNPERTTDVFFAGQISHYRRQACWKALEALAESTDLVIDGVRTGGFAQGLDRAEYLDRMAKAKIVLCPSGPRTPDSFRAYEAMEAGCAVILDATAPSYPGRGYWNITMPGCPAPVIDNWQEDLPKYVEAILADWHGLSAAVQAYWIGHKRWMATTLADDLREVGGLE